MTATDGPINIPAAQFSGAHLIGGAPLIRCGTAEQYDAIAADEAARCKALQRAALDEAASVVDAVQTRLNQGLSLAQLRSESGITQHALQRLLERAPPRDGYAGWNFEQHAAGVAQLAGWLAEAPAHSPGADAYAPTPALEAICDLIDAARTRKRLAIIVGGIGVGKTSAARAAVEADPRKHGSPGVVRIEVSESDRTVNRLLRSVYFKLVNRDEYPMGDEVMGEILKALRPGDVLILDECQRLAACAKGRGIEAVRELYDRSPASIILLGNEHLVGNGRVLDEKLYGALASRARVFKEDFLYTSEGDVDAYMEWAGVSGRSLRSRLVSTFAKQPNAAPKRPGGLRAVAALFDDAREAEGGALTAQGIMDQMDMRDMRGLGERRKP